MEVLCLAGSTYAKPPEIKTEIKVGNTYFVVSSHFAQKGVTASDKVKRILDKETKKRD